MNFAASLIKSITQNLNQKYQQIGEKKIGGLMSRTRNKSYYTLQGCRKREWGKGGVPPPYDFDPALTTYLPKQIFGPT